MEEDFEVPMDEHYEQFLRDELQPDWAKYITMDNVVRAHDDVRAIVKTIHSASKMDDIAFDLGIWGYRAVSQESLDL
jgi:hypothetical protein